MVKKLQNIDKQIFQESHLLTIVRNENGRLEDVYGIEVADPLRDSRIVHVNPYVIPKNHITKTETMNGLIKKFNENKEILKAEHDENKIACINEKLNNLANCLLREKNYIEKRMKINVSQLVKGYVK